MLDIVMPVMGGYEVIHNIRFNKKMPNLPILVVSSTKEMQQDVREAVGVDFFSKSGSVNLLIARINKFFQISETSGMNSTFREQFEELEKIENKMVNREMKMLERYILEKLNRNKNNVDSSRPGDGNIDFE